MRLTRAAQRAQEGSEPTSEPVEGANGTDCAALDDSVPNAPPEPVPCEEEVPPKTPAKTPAKKGKGKGGAKKGAKGKKTKPVEEQQEEEPAHESVQDERTAAASSSGDAVVEQVAKNEELPAPLNDERPATPPIQPTRLTRRQLAAMHEEELKKAQCASSFEEEPVAATHVESAATRAQEGHSEDTPVESSTALEASHEKSLQVAQRELSDAAHKDDMASAHKGKATGPPVPVVLHDAQQAEPTLEPDSADVAETEAVVTLEKSISQPVVTEGEIPESIDVTQSVENETHHLITVAPSVEITADSAAPISPPEPQSPQSDATTGSQTMVADRPTEQSMSPESQTPSRRRTSRSPSKSPMRIEESLVAIDALEEALDSLDAVTSFDRPIEEKSPRKKALPTLTEKTELRTKTPSKLLRKVPSKPAIASTRISRVPSAIPTGMKPTKTSLARTSSVRAVSTKESRTGLTETVDYLALKRRPISVSFPTPPPPPKGRAPTKATFQLSSNGVVAKLKAQKEERAKREADGVVPKQRPISIAAQPKSSKPPTKPTFQLPGEKTAEKLKAQKEERLKKQAEAPRKSMARPVSISMPTAPPKSVKPATKPTNFQLPGAVVAEKLKAQKEERLKRQEEAEAAKKDANSKPRIAPVRKPVTLPVRSTSGVTIPPPSQAPAQRSTSITKKRSSIVLSQPRSTSMSSTNRTTTNAATKPIVPPADPAAQRVRGKEIFNREKADKEASERERIDKENAAKKARADAAERGRIASREWAEKQRKKMMMAA